MERGILNRIIPPMLTFFVIGTLVSTFTILVLTNIDIDYWAYGVLFSLITNIALTVFIELCPIRFLMGHDSYVIIKFHGNDGINSAIAEISPLIR